MRGIRRITRLQARAGAADPAPQGGTRQAADPPSPLTYRIDWNGLATASRSCCCPARPAVMAVLPASPDRPHRTDLLLCVHHFRVSRTALAAAGAQVLGPDRRLIDPDALLDLEPS